MAVPKRKLSRRRTHTRRSQWRVKPPQWEICPHCHAPKLTQHICLSCGYYHGRKVLELEEEA
ncbi:50S ribosomal protein L32 [Candidatus Hydrogenisulfobacillus filiaventi]|uniref:Large ribosomal subunit protein bL32 n=1 Tax=Candidatus Hydrogenisulfobacillus filiaventi TaxID=2707344 RepID=A0A6F8ZHP1_9FIRM|nr:50S ribosomal protein L32 [Candidatus Hydrogenisulfobacillus filiaventi]